MPVRQDTSDYRALFLADTPMMDMRAPAEFAHGAFPSSHSLPLMTDAERAEVGTCYKKLGQEAAITLGHSLVAGELRAQRIQGWLDFARSHPDGYLYCFRGGLRSQTVQQWLRDAGIEYPLVQGGYKAMRRFLIDDLQRSVKTAELILVSGRTGVGKTRVIEGIPRAIDLEGLARHRGSAFGLLLEPQPSQIDFENAVGIALLKQLASGERRVFLEDEGRLIGRLALPDALREQMVQAPMLVVEDDLEGRVQTVLEDYNLDVGMRFQRAFGEQGPQQHRDRLQGDLLKIRKRLGGALQQELSEVMDRAFAEQNASGSPELHRQWIRALLADYYDPMYDYQLSRRDGRRLFAGSRQEVIAWAREQQG